MASYQQLPSAAFFNPQAKPVTEEYLNHLQVYLRNHGQLGPFVEGIKSLPQTWEIYARHRFEIASLDQGPRYTKALADWINGGDSAIVANATSGCCALPILTIAQISQYFQYLDVKGVKHHQLLESLRMGGVHGYCGGLLPGVAVALSSDEEELAQNAAKVLGIALGIGAYGDLGDDGIDGGSTNMVIRLKYAGQGEEIVRLFPGAHISAVTDPKTISVVGPASVLEQVKALASAQGLLSQGVHIRGKVHNPENKLLAIDLENLCLTQDDLRLPSASKLKVSFRSNLHGKSIGESLTHEIIQTILTSRCEWYRLLEYVAGDLSSSGDTTHHLVNFGTGDCLSLTPFHQHGLAVTKSDAMSVIKKASPKVSYDPKVSYEYPPNAVAVIGMACRFPGANNVEELWHLISTGKSTVQELPKERVDSRASFRFSQDHKWASRQKFFGNFMDRPDSFDHAFFGLNPREAVYMDPQQRLLLETAYQAVEASGYLRKHQKESGDAVGVFIGNTSIDYLANTTSYPPSAYTSTGTLGSFLCGRIGHHFGWTGPAELIDTACSSSLVAINRACKAIQHGECSMALAGGVNVISNMDNFLDLGKAGFLSSTGQCKPFANDADGYCRAEGVGIVFLKSLNQALRENDRVLGVICGAASNQGGLSSSITVPHSPTQTALYRKILEQANMKPSDISYVEAHGTGTQVGDPLEIASIREVFGGSDRETTLQIGSIKGNIGHCETAAGVAGFIKAILLLQKGIIPPLASHTSLNQKIPGLDPDRMAMNACSQDWTVSFRAVCINSYGAAGSNAAVLLCQPPSRSLARLSQKEPVSGSSYPFLLSAHSEASLIARANDLCAWFKGNGSQLAAADIAFTLAEKHPHHRFRWSSTSQAPEVLCHVADKVVSTSRPRSIVLVFCGQVDQAVGLNRVLYEDSGLFRSHIDRCDQIVRSIGLPSIIPTIFQTEPITDIRILHCCLFAQQYAFAQCWIESGLKVDAMVGQSFGELTALAIGGHLSLKDTLSLIARRASIIQSQWGDEQGNMLTVRCNIDKANQVIAEMKRRGKNIDIACYNAEDSLVLGGTADAITATERWLQQEPTYGGFTAKKLRVTHAYHTILSEVILDDLEAAASNFEFNVSTIPLATSTRDLDQTITPTYIRSHMRDPVYFQAAVRRLEERFGDSIWLEAGCDSPAFAVLKSAIASPERHIIQAVKINGSKRPMDMIATITSDLWREGIDLSYWDFHNPCENGLQHVWLPPYHFQETRHWLPLIDHAMEASRGNSPKTMESAQVDKLVTQLHPQSHGDVERFEINTSTQRFIDIVTGHSVLGRQLCPAGLYMECASTAAQLLMDDQQNLGLIIEDCSFECPLVSLDRSVMVALGKCPSKLSWSFEVSSTSASTSHKSSIHAKGCISFQNNVQLQHYQRLVSRRVQELESTSSETLLKDKAYTLFTRVVNYSDIFKGISMIKFADTEALAEVNICLQAPTFKTMAARSCDTISLDVFVQVCGLLINSHSFCVKDSAYLAVGAESIRIAQTCDLEECRDWTVYAAFEPVDENKAKGDVFVMRRSGEVVIVMVGLQFAKVALKTLKKLLDAPKEGGKRKNQTDPATNLTHEAAASPPRLQETQSTTSFIRSDNHVHSSSPRTDDKLKKKRQGADDLREVVASYAGLSSDQVRGQTNLGALGIDSLASIELADNISSRFDVQVSATSLLDTDFATLCSLLGLAQDCEGNETVGTPGITLEKSKQLPQAIKVPLPKKQQRHDVRQQLAEVISRHSGYPTASITDNARLEELGIDSLAKIELRAEIEAAFNTDVNGSELTPETTFLELLQLLGPALDASEELDFGEANSSATSLSSIVLTPMSPQISRRSCLMIDPIQALADSDKMFPQTAKENGFTNHWDIISPKYDKIVVAYIVEAFAYMGADLRRIQPDGSIPTVAFLPKHSQVMQCLWDILEQQGITYCKAGTRFRTSKRIIDVRSSQLSRGYIGWHPKYTVDFTLMALTGPPLADCLTGAADPLKILFGDVKAQQVLSDFYHRSPMLATMTDQLIIFIKQVVTQAGSDIIRIMEIGAGFGGTTTALARMLEQCGLKVEYTFTDVAPTLVDKAKQKFSAYSWMDFRTLNLDQDPPSGCLGQYDVVLATNVVHATKDLVASTTRMKSLLKAGGFICLSEITKVIDWHNIVFGLLPGWWSFTDGRTYALQSAEEWMSIFKKAGFESTGYSTGSSPEAKTQQLLIGSTIARQEKSAPFGASKDDPVISTVVYKTVSETDIHADIYFPDDHQSSGPMPIALMVHGGGYMTLSRTAVRPNQTKFLLRNGILPVSLDHRLCPQVNIITGPMADVRDAVAWARYELPEIAMTHGISVDASKIAVIGWSTGGHLAMTTAWTTVEAGNEPPNVILNFYGPSDFEALGKPSAWDVDHGLRYADNNVMIAAHHDSGTDRSSSIATLCNSQSNTITSYHPNGQNEAPQLGWLARSDPRSDLVHSQFQNGGSASLSLLLNGVSSTPNPITQSQIEAISPIAQLRKGSYNVPTFIVHGSEDEILPCNASVAFDKAMRERGIESGICVIEGAKHLHDLGVEEGSEMWMRGVGPGYEFLLKGLGIRVPGNQEC
ncbi:MAG: hypothetical protein Q9224_001556 [Gallowayella concinna]